MNIERIEALVKKHAGHHYDAEADIRAALTEQAETHAIELRAYEATVANLEHQLETERMRLAACGVIALANTPETAVQAREMLPEYWSASAKDCADMVDREMALRERIRQMEADLALEDSGLEFALEQLVNVCNNYNDACNWSETISAEAALERLYKRRLAAAPQPKEGS